MEVQDNPNPNDVTEKEASQVRARPGEKYPIRMLHYSNGMLIIGFVICVFPETTMLLRPHSVEVVYNSEETNIEGYEFTPYLDQMIYYDPHDLTPIPFMNAASMSLVRPAPHLISNYTDIIRLKETMAFRSEDDYVEFYKRSYVNPRTRH